MRFDFSPYLRFVSKTTYFINDEVIANDCRILYVLEGEGSIVCNGTEYDLKPNTLIYIPYALWYRIKAEKTICFYAINFDFSQKYKNVKTMVPKKRNEFSELEILCTVPKEFEELFCSEIYLNNAMWAKAYLEQLYMEYLNLNDGYDKVQNACLKILLIKICRFLSASKKTNALCEKIKAEIKSDLKANVKSIAGKLNYHPYYLNDIFKNSENITLHQYLMQQRIIQSEKLLLNTKMTLEEIADFCGFSSHSHFSTVFKKKNNISPCEFRKLI